MNNMHLGHGAPQTAVVCIVKGLAGQGYMGVHFGKIGNFDLWVLYWKNVPLSAPQEWV